MNAIAKDARVLINSFGGSVHAGEYGTVIRGEHPAIITGRPCVEVAIDGIDPHLGEIFYVSEVDEVPA